jgi:hypothetical protein
MNVLIITLIVGCFTTAFGDKGKDPVTTVKAPAPRNYCAVIKASEAGGDSGYFAMQVRKQISP